MNNMIMSPYSYPGLKSKEQFKARNSYFLKKLKKAKQLFSNTNGSKKPFCEVKLDRLTIALEEFTGVSKEELLSYYKVQHLADIRNVIIAVAVRLRLGSLKDIGRYFNRKNHTTIHAAAKKGHILIKQDSDLNDLYKKLLYSVS